MKIRTRKLSYEEVLKLPRLQHKKPLKPSRFLATVVRIVSAQALWETKFSYTTERMRPFQRLGRACGSDPIPPGAVISKLSFY